MELFSPFELKKEYPLSPRARDFIADSRTFCQKILQKKEDRMVAIVGPCSVHDPEAAIEYALNLRQLGRDIGPSLFPIMRLFIEKSRTRLGWKGMLYDPHLDGSNDIAAGLKLCRKLWVELAELGVPCATELLDPVVVPYFDDLITWGLIGARTAASQPHRQMASALSFPVGFKNEIHGQLEIAISGVLTSRTSQSHIGINGEGKIAILETPGNRWTHLVLRGSESGPNYDPDSVTQALVLLKKCHLEPQLLIDCAHGNSGKDHRKQRIVLKSILEQKSQGNEAILGFMLESYLASGKQPLGDDKSLLRYGVSITDSCLSWEETESLLREAADSLKSMSSVQK